jgi:hypothetical protein
VLIKGSAHDLEMAHTKTIVCSSSAMGVHHMCKVL